MTTPTGPRYKLSIDVKIQMADDFGNTRYGEGLQVTDSAMIDAPTFAHIAEILTRFNDLTALIKRGE